MGCRSKIEGIFFPFESSIEWVRTQALNKNYNFNLKNIDERAHKIVHSVAKTYNTNSHSGKIRRKSRREKYRER